jgi:hypothetical protein
MFKSAGAWTSYQPVTRFWPFQYIEADWRLALSLLLMAATIWRAEFGRAWETISGLSRRKRALMHADERTSRRCRALPAGSSY